MAYIVTLIHEEDGRFGASFPDFPGATTVAENLDTLYLKAAEAIAFHVEGMAQDGDDIPEPRTLSEMRSDPEFRVDSEGAMIALLQVDLPGKSVRVNISIDESLLKRLDRAVEASGETRSGFLAQAVKERLAANL